MQLAELPAEIRPRTLSQGYDVQDRLLALLGEPVAGWKLGGSAARRGSGKPASTAPSPAASLLRGSIVPVRRCDCRTRRRRPSNSRSP